MKNKVRKSIRRKISALLVLTVSAVLFAACGSTQSADTSDSADADTAESEDASDDDEVTIVTVGSRYDNLEIWEAVNAELEDDNIQVENIAFESSVNLNDLLIAGEIDMNCAQHYAAIEYTKASDDKYADLIALGDMGISTLDLYSNKYDSVDDLPDGATIALPNDVMNGGRALIILADNGLLTLDDNYEQFPDETNIVDNPKNLQFTEVASDSMIRILDDVDAGFAYSPNAVDAGLDLEEDPILKDVLDLENNETQSQFIIVFTGVAGDEENEVYQKVIEAYHTEAVWKAYKEIYNGGTIPVVDGVAIDIDSLK